MKIRALLILLVFVGSCSGVYYPRLEGDINDDCKVDLIDLALMGKSWHTENGDALWNDDADFDGNGKINLRDLVVLGRNWGRICKQYRLLGRLIS